jgi:alanine racemase
MLNPVKLTAPIIQVQKLKCGSTVGYNRSFTTKRDTIIATLPIGYADGYLRASANRGHVYIAGYFAKIVGRISMDLINVDVTDIPSVHTELGSMVEVIGDHCTPDEIAMNCGTIGYEVLTAIGSRYDKLYLNNLVMLKK